MILARIAVYGAILCTLWFNGSYAWSQGGTPVHQAGMVAVAITIDLCKCGFLTAASYLWHQKWRGPALMLVLLWPMTFAYSTFSGFAAITTNRADTSSSKEGQAQQRARVQANYDTASATLALASQSPLWTLTTACTAPKTTKHRAFCTNIATAKTDQHTAATLLSTTSPTAVDPEVSVLQATTGLPLPTLLLVIAFVPALILELVSSVGFYAINRPAKPEANRKPIEGLLETDTAGAQSQSQKRPVGRPEALASKPPMPTPKTPPTQAQMMDWVVP